MVYQTQSDFSTIAKYEEVIKQGTVKCVEMGNCIPGWLLNSFFCLGLNPDLELYTFQMVNTMQTQKQELEIDKIIIALVNYNWRQQFSEYNKALAAKKEKSKSVIENKGSIVLPTAMLLSTKKDNGKKRCKHYDSACYNKKSCYYLMLANQCPVNWEPYLGKKHLL